MANLDSGNPFRSDHWASLKKAAFEIARQGVAVAALLLMVVYGSWAQEIDSSGQTSSSQTSSQTSTPQPQQPNSQFVLPAGTKLPLGLLRPLQVKPGRDIYLQITFPVTVGTQMLIPPGAYVQGVVANIIKKDRRSLQFSITYSAGPQPRS
jgi:hypothetical protein